MPGLVATVYWINFTDISSQSAIQAALFRFLLYIYPIYLIAFFVYVALLAPLKWVVLGQRAVGSVKLQSSAALRIWLHNLLMEAPLMQFAAYLISETPFVNWLGNFLGGHIGEGSRIPCSAGNLANIDMLDLGAYSSLGAQCSVLASVVSGDMVYSDRIRIGRYAGSGLKTGFLRGR